MTAIWVNGRLGDGDSATVAALDHGLTVGDGIFETCLVIDNKAVALTRHQRRLERSAEVLDLECPDRDVVRRAVTETLRAAGSLPLGRLRITVTGGAGPLGSDRGGATPTLLVAASGMTPWPEAASAVSVPWVRNERSAVAGAKTTSYAENVVALAEAHRQGANEALLANTVGHLCEGTGSNVVVVVDGALRTPPLSSGCLAGITRELFLEWARHEGLDVREEDLPFAVLAETEDVLLTSSTRGVQQLAAVDGRALAGSKAGLAAVEMYGRRLADDLDP